MRRNHILALSLAAFAPLAHADTLFSLNAAYANGDTAAGTLDLDTTTGLILGGAATLSTSTGVPLITATIAPGPPAMGIQRGRGSFDALLVYAGPGSPSPTTFLQLDLPTTTLVGYTGSAVVLDPSFSNLILPNAVPVALTSGGLTPMATTPEPSTFVLLGTGLATLATLRRFRA